MTHFSIEKYTVKEELQFVQKIQFNEKITLENPLKYFFLPLLQLF